MGGIFGEGIDLVGERLVGAIVVGVGLPQICQERDLIKDYYNQRETPGFEVRLHLSGHEPGYASRRPRHPLGRRPRRGPFDRPALWAKPLPPPLPPQLAGGLYHGQYRRHWTDRRPVLAPVEPS